MQLYIIYNTETGEISGACFCDNPADQCGPGQSYRPVPMPVTGDTHRLDLATGLVCLRDDAVAMPPPPAPAPAPPA